MFGIIFGAILTLAFFVYYKLSTVNSYWNKKRVKGPTPELFYGNFRNIVTKKDSVTSLMKSFYNQYPNEKIVGIYQMFTPALVVRDPDIIKRILVKDFNSFTDRGFRITDEPLSNNLFSLDGDEWKILRQRLTPIFSTGKLKQMMPILNNIVRQYMQYVDKIVDKQEPQEITLLTMKYTLKNITTVAFGLNIDIFTQEKCEFTEMANSLFASPGIKHILAALLDGIKPGILKSLPVSLIAKNTSMFFMDLVNHVIREREGKPKIRKDFMDMMIDLKEQGTLTNARDKGVAELEITDEVITAQAALFYAAGFETSSSSMSFMLYELAKDQGIQNRCYQEIKRIMEKCDGEMTYEALNELEYVSMTFDEALRKHPVVGVLRRQCVTDFEIPELGVTIEKGTKIYLPMIGLHHDPQYFPEPDNFDPERFAPENRTSLQNETYMPFGHGPRNCIGLRFAKVQSILGIAHFLFNYKVTLSEKTPTKLTYDPAAFVAKSIDGLWLNIERRT